MYADISWFTLCCFLFVYDFIYFLHCIYNLFIFLNSKTIKPDLKHYPTRGHKHFQMLVLSLFPVKTMCFHSSFPHILKPVKIAVQKSRSVSEQFCVRTTSAFLWFTRGPEPTVICQYF